MRHRIWFRLVLKAIGVLLIGFSAPDLIYSICNYSAWSYYQPGWSRGATNMPDWMGFALQIVASVAQIIIGLFLIIGSQWVAKRVLPAGAPFCQECGYDLTGSAGPRCPECGFTIDQDSKGEASTEETGQR